MNVLTYVALEIEFLGENLQSTRKCVKDGKCNVVFSKRFFSPKLSCQWRYFYSTTKNPGQLVRRMIPDYDSNLLSNNYHAYSVLKMFVD